MHTALAVGERSGRTQCHGAHPSRPAVIAQVKGIRRTAIEEVTRSSRLQRRIDQELSRRNVGEAVRIRKHIGKGLRSSTARRRSYRDRRGGHVGGTARHCPAPSHLPARLDP